MLFCNANESKYAFCKCNGWLLHRSTHAYPHTHRESKTHAYTHTHKRINAFTCTLDEMRSANMNEHFHRSQQFLFSSKNNSILICTRTCGGINWPESKHGCSSKMSRTSKQKHHKRLLEWWKWQILANGFESRRQVVVDCWDENNMQHFWINR